MQRYTLDESSGQMVAFKHGEFVLFDDVKPIIKAITVKGSHPDTHDATVKRHRREWPSLWRAIDRLLS